MVRRTLQEARKRLRKEARSSSLSEEVKTQTMTQMSLHLRLLTETTAVMTLYSKRKRFSSARS